MSKEIQQISAKISELEAGAPGILATVVEVLGSAYRLPGAKMLIMENGDTFGSVSGGCLEADVMERAKRVLKTGEASVFTYDTAKDENSVFDLNMGCRGVIRILLETLTSANQYLKTLESARQTRNKQFAATLVSASGEDEYKIGGRVFYDERNEFRFENLPFFLTESETLKYEVESFFRSENFSETKIIHTEKGDFEFFFENIAPPLALLIFGAGADAIPLAETGKSLGWQISVADHRPAYLALERFPFADELFALNGENSLENLRIDDQTAVVIMTHNYERDRKILSHALNSEAFYVGALGPKRRTENLLNELKASGENFSEDELKKLFAPVGLDLGADTPESIALAIAAEIQAVVKTRAGGFLRERRGSIYGRSERF